MQQPNQAAYWLYAEAEFLTNWQFHSRIKQPTDFIQKPNWQIGDAAAESGRWLTDFIQTDFMQKPNYWRIGDSTVVSSYLLTVYRSQIGKSAMQQANRAGDLLTLYRSQISKSAMQQPNRAGDLPTLYRSQIGKSAMQQRNNRVGDFMHTDFMQETIILTSSWVESYCSRWWTYLRHMIIVIT